MLLIADSGSTKTHWRLLYNSKQFFDYSTQGINPFFQNFEEINNVVINELLSKINTKISVTNIFFYGAGCSSEERNAILKKVLQNHFANATIEVAEDTLGAARAMCFNQEGIIGILGTGSNTVYYDGNNIITRIGGLGYILGDEGSGAHIGKTLIKALLNNDLPDLLTENFKNNYNLNTNDILNAVYKKSFPSRFLASFNLFVYKNINNDFLSNMVYNCIQEFFDANICKHKNYKNLTFSCIGSVAFVYKDIICKIANEKEIKIGHIEQSPMNKLALYHLNL